MTPFEAALDSLQDSLAYRFQNPSLLTLALSVLRPPLSPEAAAARQRLEFLGDAAWGLAVAEAVFQTWPQATAGDLTRFRSAWCSTQGLARIARQVRLPLPDGPRPAATDDPEPQADNATGRRRGPRDGEQRAAGSGQRAESAAGTRAGPSDRVLAEVPSAGTRGESSAGRAGPSDRVLAELLEAVLGAMVEDGGLDGVRALARRMISRHSISTTTPPVDPKSALQMLAQARYGTLPAYRLLARRGPPHQPTFRVVVRVNGEGIDIQAEAEGTSRQAAEQEAAGMALRRMNVGDSI